MIPKSTFNSVCEKIVVSILWCLNSIRFFESDNKQSLKNIDSLKSSLSYINEITRQELSNAAKDFGNQLISKYEELAEKVNEERCENLRLQMEIANLIKEKNTLRHDLKVLFSQTRKLEVILGVKPDPKFENIVNQNIFT